MCATAKVFLPLLAEESKLGIKLSTRRVCLNLRGPKSPLSAATILYFRSFRRGPLRRHARQSALRLHNLCPAAKQKLRRARPGCHGNGRQAGRQAGSKAGRRGRDKHRAFSLLPFGEGEVIQDSSPILGKNRCPQMTWLNF